MTRDINIRPVLNGFICQVGCQTVVFEDTERLLNNLRKYMDNPSVVEQWFIENSINKDMLKQPTTQEPARGIEYLANTQGVTQQHHVGVDEQQRR